MKIKKMKKTISRYLKSELDNIELAIDLLIENFLRLDEIIDEGERELAREFLVSELEYFYSHRARVDEKLDSLKEKEKW